MTVTPEILRLARPPQDIIHLLFERSRSGCFIALHTRRERASGGEGYLPFTVLPVTHRQAFLPFLDILPDQTKGVGVNTLKRSALKHGVSEETYLRAIEEQRQRFYFNRAHHVAELTAIFADLDVGKPHDDGLPPITGIDAMLEVQRLALNGLIPFPSMLALSGTGAYALWCLKEKDSLHPPKCTVDNVRLWELATNGLHKILDRALLYPDPRARARLTQVMKAPGTIDTKTGNPVVYLVPYIPDESGVTSVPVSTLHGLLERLDIPTIDAPTQRREIAAPIPPMPTGKGVPSQRYALKAAKNPSPKDGGTSKAQAWSRARLHDLVAVAQSRGGFKEGTRHYACLHYYGAAWSYYGIKHLPDEAHTLAGRDLWEFNRRWCAPSLPGKEVTRIMEGKRLRSSYYNIMADLHITDDESRGLNLRQLMPKADREQRAQVKGERRGFLTTRRAAIEAMIRAGKANREIYGKVRKAAQAGYTVADLAPIVCRMRKRLGIPNPKHTAHPSQAPLIDPYADRRQLLREQAKAITGR